MKNLPALVAVLLGILILAVPVSAEVLNLSQPYSSALDYHKYENFDSPLSTSSADSVILWVRFWNMPTSSTVVFTVTMNDLSQVTGSIVIKDTSLVSGQVTTTLGGIENTTTYSHLPLIGIAPQYILGYGMDSNGYHYLLLLPTSRIGPSPLDGRPVYLDTALDPHQIVNPPLTNPIIQFEKSTGSTAISMDAYTATMTYLQEGEEGGDKEEDLLGLLSTNFWGLLGIIGFAASFALANLKYMPLAAVLGEGLLFLYCIDKRSDILAGIGMFAEKNIDILDKIQSVLSYVIDWAYKVFDAIFKWL